MEGSKSRSNSRTGHKRSKRRSSSRCSKRKGSTHNDDQAKKIVEKSRSKSNSRSSDKHSRHRTSPRSSNQKLSYSDDYYGKKIAENGIKGSSKFEGASNLRSRINKSETNITSYLIDIELASRDNAGSLLNNSADNDQSDEPCKSDRLSQPFLETDIITSVSPEYQSSVDELAPRDGSLPNGSFASPTDFRKLPDSENIVKWVPKTKNQESLFDGLSQPFTEIKTNVTDLSKCQSTEHSRSDSQSQSITETLTNVKESPEYQSALCDESLEYQSAESDSYSQSYTEMVTNVTYSPEYQSVFDERTSKSPDYQHRVGQNTSCNSRDVNISDSPSDTVLASNLSIDVTEPEIRMTISNHQGKVRRPDQVKIEREKNNSKAILTFPNASFAEHFLAAFECKFLSDYVNLFFVGGLSKKSTLSANDCVQNSCANDQINKAANFVSPIKNTENSQISIKFDSSLQSKSPSKPSDEPFLACSAPVSEDDMNFNEDKKTSVKTSWMVEEFKVEPIFVCFEVKEYLAITKVRVYMLKHRKFQLFYGREPPILLGGLLRYILKYYKANDDTRLAIVLPCIASYGLFMDVISSTQKLRLGFHSLFSLWTDLEYVVNKSKSQAFNLNHITFDDDKIRKLVEKVTSTNVEDDKDSLLLMKAVLDSILSSSNDGLRSFEPSSLRPFCLPCLMPKIKYLCVILHVGIFQSVDDNSCELLPSIGTIGFRNNVKGSWFVPVDINNEDKPIPDEESVRRLGFYKKNEKQWVWGEDGRTPMLPEDQALESLLISLQEEKDNGRFEGVIVLTPFQNKALVVLLNKLSQYSLLDSFLLLVNGIGNVEKYIKKYQLQYGKGLDISKVQNVPKIVYNVMKSFLGETPSYQKFTKDNVYTIRSPYTNNLLNAKRTNQDYELENTFISPETGSNFVDKEKRIDKTDTKFLKTIISSLLDVNSSSSQCPKAVSHESTIEIIDLDDESDKEVDTNNKMKDSSKAPNEGKINAGIAKDNEKNNVISEPNEEHSHVSSEGTQRRRKNTKSVSARTINNLKNSTACNADVLELRDDNYCDEIIEL